MSNYLEGALDFSIKTDTPKNILDFFNNMDNIFNLFEDLSVEDTYKKIIEESGIKEFKEFITDDIYENPFPNISVDIVGEDTDEKYINIWIKVCNRKNFERLDIFLEACIAVLKPYQVEDSINYLGILTDKDGEFYKEYFYDRKEFHEEQKSREFLCNGCKKLKQEALCDNYYICERAYKLGCERQFKADFGVIDLNETPSLKEAIKNGVGK